MAYDKTGKQKGVEINVFAFFRLVLKKWWIVVCIALAFAVLGASAAKLTHKDSYTSSVSFVVNTLNESQQAGSSDVVASINIAYTYQYIFESNAMIEKIANNCNANVSKAQIKKCLTTKVIESTSVIEVYITTDSAETSYQIAKTLVERYDSVVSDVYDNAHVRICDHPEKASLPDTDSSTILFCLIGGIIGGILSVAVLMIYFMVHDTVRTAQEVSSKLGLNVIGSVSQITKNDNKKNLLMVDRRTGFAFIETYKAIRTKIENNAMKDNNKVYMISSACENEGKTTVATNIALALAQNGKSVLLIDADLRKPSICKILDISATGKSLIDVILGKAKLEDSIKYVEKYNIFILADSNAADNPSELLSTKRMEDIIKSVKNEFDYIIIDTAPASVVTDASVISTLSDASILVVREDAAPISRIKMAIDDIDSNGAYVIGCIYNNTTDNSSGTYYKYGKKKYGGYGGYGGYGSYGSTGYGQKSK